MSGKQEIVYDLSTLRTLLNDRLKEDHMTRVLYATDASVYRRLPVAVAFPRNRDEISEIVSQCSQIGLPLIPRTAGTSLAGQCVGEALVIDFSKYFNKIISLNTKEKWVEIEPGVIRDELNDYLEPHGLFFGPNTSTSNRCMLGGMVGNNSCGTTSIRYGTTRDKVEELEVVLNDGTPASLRPCDQQDLSAIKGSHDRLSQIINGMVALLSPEEVRKNIRDNFPKKSIHRRNTGYAVDLLSGMQPFEPAGAKFNPAKLIAGSEGTLCVVTKMKLKLDDLPPREEAVVCAHFTTIHEAMKATVIAMKSRPYACEVMDKTILDLTKGNPEQADNRFFVEGDPGAILCVEMRASDSPSLDAACHRLISEIQNAGFGFAFPIVKAPDTKRVWNLRAAGLGVLSNMKGNAKPVAFVEDTAVELVDLPAYIEDFERLMKGFGQQAVYYAHAGAGELHLRPVLDLKSQEGRADFRRIGEASAALVKKYGGSLSGEHGDGRVRAEFIPKMVGRKNYELLREVKRLWDPDNIFNPGKIVDPDPLDIDFRYESNQKPFEYGTFLDFSAEGDMLALAEKCNGSGDCRKLPSTGATMCPSYHATRDEKDSTRARANLLREVLTRSPHRAFPFDDTEIHEVLDLCLSCKACKRECPSSVDMASLKMETDYQFYLRNGVPRRNKFFGLFHRQAKLGSKFAPLSNALLNVGPLERSFKRFLGIALQRSIPRFSGKRATSLIRKYNSKKPEFVLYIDEFTQYQDAHVALAAAEFFHALGYEFRSIYLPSARACLSKSLLKEAKHLANNVLTELEFAVENDLPIVGLEPSGILGFRDEFLRLFRDERHSKAKKLASRVKTFEEFVADEINRGRVKKECFNHREVNIELHLHCHQKALSHPIHSLEVLNFPPGHQAVKIPSGCCGMAGSFGYEKEHFDISNQIGEQVLFPRIRALEENTLVVAAGTSCRHQILDAVKRKTFHPAEILRAALK